MQAQDLPAYVRAALKLQGYDFPPAVEQEVAEQFVRIHAIASAITQLELPETLEAAPVFRP